MQDRLWRLRWIAGDGIFIPEWLIPRVGTKWERAPWHVVAIAIDGLEDLRVHDLHADEIVAVEDVHFAEDGQGAGAFVEVSRSRIGWTEDLGGDFDGVPDEGKAVADRGCASGWTGRALSGGDGTGSAGAEDQKKRCDVVEPASLCVSRHGLRPPYLSFVQYLEGPV